MTSYGQQLLQCKLPGDAVSLESSFQRGEKFAELDALVSELTFRSLRGDRLALITEDERRGDSVQILDLNPSQEQFIENFYDIARQRERGSWSLPEKEHIPAGLLNLAHNFSGTAFFPMNAADGEISRIKLETSPSAVFLWSVLCPFMKKLLHPIELRSSLAGYYDHEVLKQIWIELDEFYTALGIGDIHEIQVFRFRGGWSKLVNRAAQLEAKRKLVAALSTKINASTGTAYRLYALRPLIAQYYKKAKSDGIVKRKDVITKALQPLLTGFFGGDWLALVDYLEESPHPDEQIVTSMPKTKIYAGGNTRAKEIAVQQGIPIEEAEKIAAALWQKPSGDSPIEERIACLKKYWKEFDILHSQQKSGMRSFWGLVEENGRIDFESFNDEIFYPRLYLEVLPADLVEEIGKLWGTTMLNKYPESIVSEPFPHAVMAEVFGPALLFWQNCALTAWFLCEGPSSRTDMTGLEHHQRHNLTKLEDIGTPIDNAMFSELIVAEKKLGPAESIVTESYRETLEFGITISMSTSSGSKLKGFEKLRDIVTRYRRVWAEKYLDQYLKTRWESEITQAANTFFLKISEKGGKAPTLKQFASTAALPTKHWFGGNIGLLYTAIGEKVPLQPERSLLMPADRIGFVKKVAELLPSRPFIYYDGQPASSDNQQYYVRELAEKALNFVQVREASGKNPQLKEFSSKFKYRSVVLHEDETKAWEIYEAAVEKALQLFNSRVQAVQQSTVENETVVQKQAQNISSAIALNTPVTIKNEEKLPVQKHITETAVPPVNNKPPAMNQDIKPTFSRPLHLPKEKPVQPQQKHRSWLDRLLGRNK
jgi:hypothetical protein